MALRIEDWTFMQQNGIALRHVGEMSRYVADFSAGNTGDAIPLAGASGIIKHERDGGAQGSSFMPAHKNDIAGNLDDFNTRLRDKLVDIVDKALRFASHDPQDGSASHFMILRGKDGATSPYDYSPDGTYPLGKSGKTDLSANQILSVIRLTDDDRDAMRQSGVSKAEYIADKVIESIPKLRKMTQTMDAGREQENALTTLSAQAQIIIDGHMPVDALPDEINRFSRNMQKLSQQDPQSAANFCCSVLSHPKLGALADAAQNSYRHAMTELAGRDPAAAASVAGIHKEVYGDKAPALSSGGASPARAAPAVSAQKSSGFSPG